MYRGKRLNTKQLEIAQKEWSHAMDITLIKGRIYVANDGFITDLPLKPGKHTGEHAGFYYQFTRKGTENVIRNVICTIVEDENIPCFCEVC